MVIRAVMFDFGNVVGIFDTPRFHAFLREHRTNCRDPKEVFSGSMMDILRRYDRGEIDNLTYFYLLQQAFQLENVTMKEFFEVFGGVLEIDREMLKIRDDLRRMGVLVALVTNMNPFHAGYIRRNYPEVFNGFDHNFISCEEGIAKPDPEAWIRTLDHLGLKAEETVFVDDYIVNVEAACRLGIKGWHYNVTDHFYCQNGKLEQERQKLRDFLTLLDSLGILHNKSRH